jgi:hypothetical protein
MISLEVMLGIATMFGLTALFRVIEFTYSDKPTMPNDFGYTVVEHMGDLVLCLGLITYINIKQR